MTTSPPSYRPIRALVAATVAPEDVTDVCVVLAAIAHDKPHVWLTGVESSRHLAEAFALLDDGATLFADEIAAIRSVSEACYAHGVAQGLLPWQAERGVHMKLCLELFEMPQLALKILLVGPDPQAS
jgi:hypothetical protein